MPMRFIEARDGYSVYDLRGERLYRRSVTWLGWRQAAHVKWQNTDRYHLTVEMAVDAAARDGLTLVDAQALVSEQEVTEISECFKCDDVVATDDIEEVDGNPWCSNCIDDYNNVVCESCSERTSLDYVMIDNGYGCDYCCDTCLMNGAAYYCDDHDLCYWADDGCESCAENASCECESPMPRFSITGIGGVRYASGEYHEVLADAGIVTADGFSQIQYEVMQWATEQYPDVEGHSVYMCHCDEEDGTEHITHALHYQIRDAIRTAAYQTWYADQSYRSESGTTIAKRLRSEIYRRTKDAGMAVSLPAALVSKIGTIARQQSEGANVLIDITRDLNDGAEEFVHEDSCWWTEYSYSRCTLKSNAGFGLRSFDDGPNGYATGRVWVFGCTIEPDGRLMPTFGDAEAYVVFNGYGDLEEHRGAQVLATLLGWSARTDTMPMPLTNDVMYVNSGSARVVAPADVLARTDLHFTGSGMKHHSYLPVPTTA